MHNPLEGSDTEKPAADRPNEEAQPPKDAPLKQQQRAHQLERLASGVAGIDTILHGGLFKGGLYMIIGEPGTGKTILSNQLCFNHVANGGRAVYVTLLVETHGRMLSHLSALTFFDPVVIGQSIQYISGAVVLNENGLDELLTLLGRVVRDYSATMLVVEGLETAELVAESELSFKHFLQSLQALVEARGCTTFLVRQSLPANSSGSMGQGVVDGLIELCDRRIGIRRIREIEVLKFRGSGYLRDTHAFTITDAGLSIYPRTEKLIGMSPPLPIVGERVRVGFGIAKLDDMMHGGPFSNSCTMLLGTPGSGKTLLGLHFLATGARKGEQGL